MNIRKTLIIIASAIILILFGLVSSISYKAGMDHGVTNAEKIRSSRAKTLEKHEKKVKSVLATKVKNTKIKNQIKIDKRALKELELIIHPLVRRKMKDFMKKKRNFKIGVFEIPLLIESKLMKYFDSIIFVGTKRNIRLRRYKGNKEIFTTLDKRQIIPSKKIKISDHVIYNNLSTKNLKKGVNFLWKR